MRKTKYIGALLLLSTLTACSSKKPVETEPVTTVAQTTVASTVEATQESTEVVEESFEYEFEEEDYDIKPEFSEEESISLSKPGVELNDITTEVGYSFSHIRKFDHDRSLEEFEDLATIQEILSGEYWTGDQVVHKHQGSFLDEEPGYYHEDDCWIEEEINIQHYPQAGLSEGWVYEDGETFADWVDQQAMDQAWGEGSRIIKKQYDVSGEKWIAYYCQRNMDEEPKEVFSPVECVAYAEEADGDFVVVTIHHNNLPTISTDEHVPPHEERMQTAQESMEVVLSTIHETK